LEARSRVKWTDLTKIRSLFFLARSK
jgi:hypothetical protein